METKREKFVRLAENRMNNALKQLSLLENLSNKTSYDYNSTDVDKIIKTLKAAVASIEHSFKDEDKCKKFSLK